MPNKSSKNCCLETSTDIASSISGNKVYGTQEKRSAHDWHVQVFGLVLPLHGLIARLTLLPGQELQDIFGNLIDCLSEPTCLSLCMFETTSPHSHLSLQPLHADILHAHLHLAV